LAYNEWHCIQNMKLVSVVKNDPKGWSQTL
jgi:hypothetical protein